IMTTVNAADDHADLLSTETATEKQQSTVSIPNLGHISDNNLFNSSSTRIKLVWQTACIAAISAVVLKLSSAWSLATYLAAVVGLVLLYWSYDPKQEKKAEISRSNRSVNRRNQSTISDRRLRPDNTLFSTLGVTCDDFLQFQAITDRFSTFQEIVEACKATQLDSFNMIVAVDFSASNEWQGRRTFHGKPLHKITTTAVSGILGSSVSKQWNPYQRVISVLDQTLSAFVPPGAGIYGLGFGHDATSTDAPTSSVFNLASECGIAQFANRSQFRNLRELLTAYNKLACSLPLGGPTDLAGVIRRSVDLVRQSGGDYHVLVIITDGQLSGNPQDSIDAIVDASDHPLSIVVIGVGDGPFHDMCEFDDSLIRRKFDNFQFVDYHRVTAKAKNADQSLALHCLMEIPDQYKSIVRQGYLKPASG
ncbi:hypothetical protein BOX15_Mlig001020g1, partial [Macrostomum lignano]